MGNALKRQITKPFRSFNVENRARRVIEKDKREQAPRHNSFEDATPPELKVEIKKKVVTKSDALHERLQDIRVVSEGSNVAIERSRNLPQDRITPSEPKFGFHEPKLVPKGKISLGKATELLGKRASNPAKYGAAEAASDYDLELNDAQNIIKYFIPMRIIDAEDDDSMKKFVKEQEQIKQKLGMNEQKKITAA